MHPAPGCHRRCIQVPINASGIPPRDTLEQERAAEKPNVQAIDGESREEDGRAATGAAAGAVLYLDLRRNANI
ncbi:hypothetical protein MRX96_016842 [Rhipicephalus microplus]